MKAAVYHQYGSPEVVVHIEDVEKPVVEDDDVLIRVRAASVNPLDEGVVKGSARMVGGLRAPKVTRLGFDVAGHVQATGRNVTRFKPGDEVFGVCIRDPAASAVEVWTTQGAFAEYACAPASTVVGKPEQVTFMQAAAVPVAGFTALQGLRDKGQIRPGHKVLINGAAGGVGTVAVQIAKSLSAEVTGVCSTHNVELVRSVGADHVIDYTKESFITRPERYDLVFDCVGNHSLSACRRVLKPNGRHVMVGDRSGRGMVSLLSRVVAALVVSRVASRKHVMFLARPRQADLTTIQGLLKSRQLVPVIDRCYRLSEVADALRYLEGGHARGKVVITLEGPIGDNRGCYR
jgi:NADPH:quinone reductase-like Zn-dependent oxidoreductase